jgi:hypothetical protein
MASEGPLFPSTGSDDASNGGSQSWSAASNIETENGSSAVASPANGFPTHWLKSAGHGFTIPEGATIDGVVVEIKAKSDFGTAHVNHLQLSLAGTPSGTDKAPGTTIPPTTFTWLSWGASNDTWGISLIASDINDVNFGVAVSASSTSVSAEGVSVDAVRITVYYHLDDLVVAVLRRHRRKSMGYFIKQNQTAQPLLFYMYDSTDHVTGLTGLSPTVTIRKPGGSFAAPSGAVTEIGNGLYQVAGNATDSNTLGPLALHATGTGADPWDDVFEVVTFDPQDAVRLGLTALPNANAEAAGGLFTRGSGAGQINQNANGQIDVRAIASSTAFLATLFTSDSGTTYASAVAGSVVKEIANNATISGVTFPTNFDAMVITAGGGVSVDQILESDLTETSTGYLAAGLKKLLDVASPVFTLASINQTGDSFARIGATGSGLTSLAPSATALSTAQWTNVRAALLDQLSHLDVDISSRLPSSSYVTPPNTAAITNAIWGALTSSYTTAGTMGKALGDASAAGDPWDVDLPGAYASGKAGFIVGTYLDAAVSGAATGTIPTTAQIAEAIWEDTTAGGHFATAGSIGLLLVTDIDAKISTRGTFSGGAVASVTGDVGGNVNGSVGSVVGAVGSVTGNVGGNVTGSVGSVAGNVTGNVGGNVVGSVASVTAGVTLANNAITSAKIQDGAITSDKFTVAAITGVATGILEKIDQTWRRWMKKHTFNKTSGQLKTYADDGTTVLTTQTGSDDGTTETLGSAS